MKVKNYILKKIDENNYLYLSLNSNRLDAYIYEIEKKLKKNKFQGNIIFDLLMNNGLKDRFYKAKFDGNNIILKTLSFTNINDKIKETSDNFYFSNIDIINNSNSLFDVEKFTMKKQLEKHLQKNNR